MQPYKISPSLHISMFSHIRIILSFHHITLPSHLSLSLSVTWPLYAVDRPNQSLHFKLFFYSAVISPMSERSLTSIISLPNSPSFCNFLFHSQSPFLSFLGSWCSHFWQTHSDPCWRRGVQQTVVKYLYCGGCQA